MMSKESNLSAVLKSVGDLQLVSEQFLNLAGQLVVSEKNRQISTRGTRKHNESLKFGEKLASVCFESLTSVTNSPFLLRIRL